VNENDVGQLEDALRRVIDSPELRRRLGDRNRRRAEEMFSPRNSLALIDALSRTADFASAAGGEFGTIPSGSPTR
jgi:glycosyltransferase involved in cell wall biosynthesis